MRLLPIERRQYIWLGLALFGCAAIMIVGTLPALIEWHEHLELRDRGSLAPASVTGSKSIQRKHSTLTVVFYSYRIENESQPRTGELKLSSNDYDTLDRLRMFNKFHQGGPVVRYLPEDPEIHCVEDVLPQQIEDLKVRSYAYIALDALTLLIALAACLWGLTARRKRRRINRDRIELNWT